MVGGDKNKIKRAVRFFYISLAVVSVLAGVVNLATYRQIPFKWAVSHLGSGGLCGDDAAVFPSCVTPVCPGILVRQCLGIQAILLLVDTMTGLHGWSVDYAIPCVVLFEVAAILLMLLVNRMNWQCYFHVPDRGTFLSFVPLVFLRIGWTKHPLLTVISVVISVSALVLTILLGDRSVKRELRRRFHV